MNSLPGYTLGSPVRPADPALGLPLLRYARHDLSDRLLVRTWLHTADTADDDLMPFWQDEVRQLKRLTAHLGAHDALLPLHDAVIDSSGFHLISTIDGHRLLADDGGSPACSMPAGRPQLWRGLQRIAMGIEQLHSQGFTHRNLNRWAILIDDADPGNLRLTGHEWSLRLTAWPSSDEERAFDAAIKPGEHAIAHDWRDFGLLARDLLGIQEPADRDSDAGADGTTGRLSSAESALLRTLELPSQLDPARLIRGIETLITRLQVSASGGEPRLNLYLKLGEANELTRAIQRASGGTLLHSDTEGQRAFVESDLGAGAVAVAAAVRGQTEDVELQLRGRQLTYRPIRDFRTRSGPSHWALATCFSASPLDRMSQRLIRQVPLDGFRVSVITRDDPATTRFGRERSAWTELRAQLETPAADDGLDLTARAFLLSQLVQGLTGMAHEFPVEIVPVATPQRKHGRYLLHLRARADLDRDALCELLRQRERLGTRLHEALTEPDRFVSDTWRLFPDTEAERRTNDSSTEWEFERELRGAAQHGYVFSGIQAAPRFPRGILVSAEAASTYKQLDRHLNAWRALKANGELLRTLTHPHKARAGQSVTLLDDARFGELDSAKQAALRQVLKQAPLALVHGPPGVGKTRLVVELARQLRHAVSSSRLLFSAQSHAAVDNLLRGVQKQWPADALHRPLIIRCRAADKDRPPGQDDLPAQAQRLAAALAASALLRIAPAHLQNQVQDLLGHPERRRGRPATAARRFAQQPFEALLMRSANLLFSTSNAGALERLLNDRAQFDWSLIEEAAKATGNELLAPLMLAPHRVLIGDHRQLPPFNAEEISALYDSPAKIRALLELGERIGTRRARLPEARALLRVLGEGDAGESSARIESLCSSARSHLFLFESLMHGSAKSVKRGPPAYTSMLSEQHRMHPEIATLVSQAFYKGALKTANTCAVEFRTRPRPFRSLNARRLPDMPIVWISTPWVQKAAGRRQPEQRPGPFNREEVHLALQALRTIEPTEPSAPEAARPTLALLSPYRAQVRALQTALNQADPALRRRLHQFEPVGGRYAHTVDSFQGREADLVIVSLVRNNHRESLRGALGFLADARRMNVLVSRARWCLILIGSRDFLADVVARFKEGSALTELEFLRRLLGGIDAAGSRGQAATWSINP